MNKKGGKQELTIGQEELKFLQLHIEQVKKEGETLKEELATQTEVSKQNKRLLSIGYGHA